MSDTLTEYESGKDLTIESIWALFRETNAQMKENAAEIAKSRAETDTELNKITKMQAETNAQMKETNAQMKEYDREFKKNLAEIAKIHAETAKMQAETAKMQAETEAQMKETDALRKEYNREIKEMFAEVAKKQAENAEQIKELGVRIEKTRKNIEESRKNIDGLNKTLGDWTEEMVRAQLWEKFRKIGFQFTKGGNQTFKNKNSQVIAEVDAFLENGEYAIPVEIKAKFTVKDVDEHIKQIEVLRAYMDERSDKRKLLGGIAGALVPKHVLQYAHGIGLYVIVQSGDSVVLAPLPKGFKHREW